MPVTLVVETGSASATANTFVDDPTFTTYCAQHGYTVSNVADTRAVALISAAEYLRNEDRYHWRGIRVSDTQRLPWPRRGAIILYGTGTALGTTVIPSAVQDAQCELAYRALSTTIQPDLERGGGIQSVSAGPVSVSYRADAMRETLVQVAMGLLKPYLRRVVDLPLSPFVLLDERGYEDQSNPGSSLTRNDGLLDQTFTIADGVVKN